MEITKSFTPSNLADWRNWLAENHDRQREVWLVYFKPASGRTNIDYESSVEEALCFGWIDSITQKIVEGKYARKFNPRRMESKWSETNKRRVLKVLREGRMTEAGMAKVTFDVGKVDTSKPKPKRPPAKMPEELEKALRECFLNHHKGHTPALAGGAREELKGLTREGKNSCESVKFVAENCPKGKSIGSKRSFKTLSKIPTERVGGLPESYPSLQRNYILWLSDAKKPETFERRLQILVDEVMTGKTTSMH